MISQADAKKALQELTGLKTEDGWIVGELLQRQSYQTGGAFSVGYLASHPDGRKAFLKALDFSRAASAKDPVRELERMTAIYNFERDVLALCSGARLSKVVTAISDGALDVPNATFGKVFYLLFELADGDVRKKAVLSNQFDVAWTIRAVQHIATGVSQLHGRDIFHQDIKPSNVLVFGRDEVSKLADLGRSHCKTIGAPHDFLVIAGARSYAPPEQLYAFDLSDRNLARASADLYLLGSVIYFLFMGVMLTPAVIDRLRAEHMPRTMAKDDGGWFGTFDDVLPYLEHAYGDAMRDFRKVVADAFGPAGLEKEGKELMDLVRYLTEPDPRRRGHPSEKRVAHSNPYSLTRFISVFDRIGNAAELSFRRLNAKVA